MRTDQLSQSPQPVLIDDGLGARLPGLLRSLRTCARGAGWVALTLVVEDESGPQVLTWPASAIRDLQVAAAPGREALANGAVVVRDLDRSELERLGIDVGVQACAAVPVATAPGGVRAAVTAWSQTHATAELVTETEVVAELLEAPLGRITRHRDPWRAYLELLPHLEDLPVGVVVLDELGVVRVWSPSATALLKVPAEAALGRALTGLGLPLPELLLAGVRPVQAQLRSSQQARIAVTGPRPPGESALAWTLSLGPQGDFVVALVRQRHPQADQADQDPCGALAHELNNALTGILLSAELLGASLPDDQRGQAHLRRILGSTHRAASLGSLLTMASGCPGLGRNPTDLAPLVDRTIAAQRELAPEGCELDLVVGGGDLVVRGDPGQLSLAVGALIENAVEATQETGGTVSTRVDRLELPTDSKACPGSVLTTGGAFVRVVVRDDGKGMGAQVLSRCTRAFFTTRDARLGLGLAAVQGLADSAGGSLVVHSRVGHGTRVELWLPAS